MYEKDLVLQVSSKSRSVFIVKMVFKQNGDFDGGRTDRQTHRRISGQGVGRGESGMVDGKWLDGKVKETN